jgi:hypothetical protein
VRLSARSFRRSRNPPSRHAHAPTVVLDGQSMNAMPTITAMFVGEDEQVPGG